MAIQASEFVESMQLGNNFFDISFRAAQVTTIYRGMVRKLGKSEAKRLMGKCLRKSVE